MCSSSGQPKKISLDNGFSIKNIVDAQPRSERGGKTTTIVAGPCSTTRSGDSSRTHGAPLEGPSRYDGVVRTRLWVLSLSVEEGICLPLALWQESGPNFKGLPKVSEVATNYWVFLRCDWLPVFS